MRGETSNRWGGEGKGGERRGGDRWGGEGKGGEGKEGKEVAEEEEEGGRRKERGNSTERREGSVLTDCELWSDSGDTLQVPSYAGTQIPSPWYWTQSVWRYACRFVVKNEKARQATPTTQPSYSSYRCTVLDVHKKHISHLRNVGTKTRAYVVPRVAVDKGDSGGGRQRYVQS